MNTSHLHHDDTEQPEPQQHQHHGPRGSVDASDRRLLISALRRWAVEMAIVAVHAVRFGGEQLVVVGRIVVVSGNAISIALTTHDGVYHVRPETIVRVDFLGIGRSRRARRRHAESETESSR